MHDEPVETPPTNIAGTPPIVPAPANLPASPIEPIPDAPGHEAAASPAWADDLRKLYNAVVEEPLPDSLIDLLSQLDSED